MGKRKDKKYRKTRRWLAILLFSYLPTISINQLLADLAILAFWPNDYESSLLLSLTSLQSSPMGSQARSCEIQNRGIQKKDHRKPGEKEPSLVFINLSLNNFYDNIFLNKG